MSEAHLDLLERLIAKLDDYSRTITRRDLETDLDTWLKVSRALELAGQCCIDLALKIAAKRGLGIAESYREAFTRLAQAQVITQELAVTLQGWAGMRNVLAHLYASVDLDRLDTALRSDLQPLRDFARCAAREMLSR